MWGESALWVPSWAACGRWLRRKRRAVGQSPGSHKWSRIITRHSWENQRRGYQLCRQLIKRQAVITRIILLECLKNDVTPRPRWTNSGTSKLLRTEPRFHKATQGDGNQHLATHPERAKVGFRLCLERRSRIPLNTPLRGWPS